MTDVEERYLNNKHIKKKKVDKIGLRSQKELFNTLNLRNLKKVYGMSI